MHLPQYQMPPQQTKPGMVAKTIPGCVLACLALPALQLPEELNQSLDRLGTSLFHAGIEHSITSRTRVEQHVIGHPGLAVLDSLERHGLQDFMPRRTFVIEGEDNP